MKRFLIGAMAACMLLSGCTKSNIVNVKKETVVGNPDFGQYDDVEIDWAQVSESAVEYFSDQVEHEYARDFSFYLEPVQKEIMLIWTVSDKLPENRILDYSEDLVKGFNDIVAEQDFSIELASDDSLGGLWDEYGLSFSIVPESTPDDESTWFIAARYEAGADADLAEAFQEDK